MLVSVITPSRNRASTYLRDCISSVACQQLPPGVDLEHVICDDFSSTEQFLELTEMVAQHPHIKLVRHDAPRGVAAARNSAFRACSGEIIIDLDDDDLLPATSVRDRISTLLSSGAPWCCGNLLVVDESLRYLPGCDLIGTAPSFSAILDGEAYCWAGSRTYWRSTLEQAGPWDESFPVAEDLEHWLRLCALVGTPAWCDAYLVLWRRKESSLGIDAVRTGVMEHHVERARARWRSTPPTNLPTWDD